MKIILKSVLEQICSQVFQAKDLITAKGIIISFIEQTKIKDGDKEKIIKSTNECKTLVRLQTYAANSLLTYEGLGQNQINKSARKAVNDDKNYEKMD